MTRKDFWLKVFAENDIALMSALIWIEKLSAGEQAEIDKEYVLSRIDELYEDVPATVIRDTFSKNEEES